MERLLEQSGEIPWMSRTQVLALLCALRSVPLTFSARQFQSRGPISDAGIQPALHVSPGLSSRLPKVPS